MDHPALEYIGQTATFYVPEGKLGVVKDILHEFFITHYDAYTCEESDIKGYWRRDPDSPIFDDKNVKYVVSFEGKHRVGEFVDFLSLVCGLLEEECLYLTMGAKSWLVKPSA